MTHDDRELRERFGALRDDDASSAPSFARLVDRGRSVPRALVFQPLPLALLMVTALVTAIVLVRSPRRMMPSADESIAQARLLSAWTAPTDAWLTSSGLEIPNSVPTLSLSSVTLPQETTTATASG